MSRFTESTITLAARKLEEIANGVGNIANGALNATTAAIQAIDETIANAARAVARQQIRGQLEKLAEACGALLADWTPETLEEIEDLIEEAQKVIATDLDEAKALLKQVQELHQQALDKARALEAQERQRLYTVDALLDSLHALGFREVQARRLEESSPASPVQVSAENSEGESLEIIIDLNLESTIEMSGYENQACTIDYHRLQERLEEHAIQLQEGRTQPRDDSKAHALKQ